MQIDQLWYGEHKFRFALLPLSYIYRAIIAARKLAYRFNFIKQTRFDCPIIVIGNLTVGGTGKTPTVIALVQWLKANGYRPGVVSRGYKGKAKTWPQMVRPSSDPVLVGDEPVLIAAKTAVPVMVGPKRVEVVSALLAEHDCNVIISDDGLQHYAMSRAFEVAVVDAKRGLGNRLCLPAGPLREPKSRLSTIDYVLVNGGQGDNGMQLKTQSIYNIKSPQQLFDHSQYQNQKVHAVAGIGNPDRFFNCLKQLGLLVIPHVLPDHAQISQADLDFDDDYPILMTEKDMVKCYQWCSDRCFALPVAAQLPDRFVDQIRLSLENY